MLEFNNPLLENDNFLSEMKDKINPIFSEFLEFDDSRINWEYLKFKMREVARSRSTELAKERREKRTNLEPKVKKFLSMDELSIDETVEYESAKQELDRIYDNIAIYIDMGVYCAQRHSGG